MSIDTIAERYGMLPSRVLQEATTFDMFVAQAAIRYRNKINETGSTGRSPDSYSQDELMQIMEHARGKGKN